MGPVKKYFFTALLNLFPIMFVIYTKIPYIGHKKNSQATRLSLSYGRTAPVTTSTPSFKERNTMKKDLGAVAGKVFIIFTIFLTVGCGMKEFNSIWRDHDVIIDGKDEGTEWEGARFFFDEQKVTIGILNDNDDLYIRLSSRDGMTQRMLLMGGLSLWFDNAGGKAKTFGIHFPVGRGQDTPRMNRQPGEDDKSINGRKTMEGMIGKMLDQSQSVVEIIGPEKNVRNTYSLAEAHGMGIEMHIDISKGNLVYELKIPLSQSGSYPYGIGTDISGTIAIGFETGLLNTEQFRQRQGGREGRGGRDGRSGGGLDGGARQPGGFGGGGGMGEMSGRRPGGPGISEPLELWIKTRMARPQGSVS